MGSLFRIGGLASLASAALLFASSATVYADANPNNHGHHYGQLKHPRQPPPPAPAPKPTAASTPIPQHPGITGAVSKAVATPNVQTRGETSSPTPVGNRVKTAGVTQPAGDYAWLLLLVLPSLMAVWLIAFAGLARLASRFRKTALEVQPAPA